MKRVVKIGGRAQGDSRMPEILAAAARATGSAMGVAGAESGWLCVVHGGGDEVSALQRQFGMEPTFRGGRRVTSPEDLEIVRMVLSGTINKRLVAQLISAGANASGLSGEDAKLFCAHVNESEAMGRVGRDLEVNPAVVHALLSAGFVPVISPVARDADDPAGSGLNVNGDDAAAALAVALGADELVLVADVPGVLDGGAVIASLDVAGAHRLIESGIAAGGMAAKLEAGVSALRGGVSTVRIASLDGISEPGAGTRLVHSFSTA